MNKLKYFMLAVIMATMMCGSTACTSRSDQFIVGTNPAFPPFEYTQAGKGCAGTTVVGWDMDMAQAFATKMGKKLVITSMDFDSILGAVGTNKIDVGMAGISITAERQKEVLFTDPVFNSSQVIITKNDNTTIVTPMDLAGKTVGSQRGTIGQFLGDMNKDFAYDTNADGSVNMNAPLLGTPAKSLAYDNGAAAVQALINGQVDAVIIDEFPAKQYVSANSALQIVPDKSNQDGYAAIYNDAYAFAIKLGNTALQTQLNGYIRDMKADGEMDAITKKYFGA